MISSKFRFHGQNGIRYVYRKGQTIRTKHGAVKYLTNTPNDSYRISVVVSKKVSKSAPVRNRIRRRLYEQFRLLAPGHLGKVDVVVTVFDQELAVAPAAEVEQFVKRVIKAISSPK